MPKLLSGIQQKRLEEDLCWIVPLVPPPSPSPDDSVGQGMNWITVLILVQACAHKEGTDTSVLADVLMNKCTLALLSHNLFSKLLWSEECIAQWVLHGRAPNDAQFVRLLCTRMENHPHQVCPVHGVDPLNFLVRGVFTLYSFVLCVNLNKWECVLCQIYYNQEPDIILPPSVAVTLIAVQCTISSVIYSTFSVTLLCRFRKL